ncbi:MAG: hypothetical protein R8G66_10195 [Cytophagales bacterium]|nr:hypothetical protein [Cytophagales bacterium]
MSEISRGSVMTYVEVKEKQIGVPIHEKEYLMKSEAAIYANVSRSTIYGWIEKGFLTLHKYPDIDKHYLRRSEIDQALKRNETTPYIEYQVPVYYSEAIHMAMIRGEDLDEFLESKAGLDLIDKWEKLEKKYVNTIKSFK